MSAHATGTDVIGLLPWADACAERGHHAYVLLDSAHAEGSHQRLHALRVAYLSLFEGKPEQSLPEIAPLLIALSGLDVARRSELVSWISQLGFGAPCLSWYESVLTPTALAAHLRNFHRVALSDGQAMLMRWYDTRILPIWLHVLTPAQLAVFAGGIVRIDYLDRFGEIRQIYGQQQAGPASRPLPLDRPLISLDDRQLGLLTDAGDLDVLVNHLKFVIPDETRRAPPRTLLDFTARYQQQAIAAGLDDIDRQTQYVLMALCTSGHGTAHPALQALMAAPPASADTFSLAMQAMPPDLWESGPPLWDQVNT